MRSPAELDFRIDLYARAWIEERLRVLRELCAKVPSTPSEDVVHDVRVCCRRLLVTLDVFEGVADLRNSEAVIKHARRLARAVRRLRELDVTAKVLEKVSFEEPAGTCARAVAAELRDDRRLVATRKASKLEQKAAKIAREADRAEFVDPSTADDLSPRSAGESPMREFIDACVEQRRARVLELCRDLLGPTARACGPRRRSRELHRIRVAIKGWRYANELARPLAPRTAYRASATTLRRLQELGGRAQDWVDIAESLERAASVAAHDPDGYARLAAEIEARRETAADDFARALRDLLEWEAVNVGARSARAPRGRADGSEARRKRM